LRSASQKFKDDVKTIDDHQGRKKRKQKEAFYKRSNYMLNEILLGGEVLFNDPVSSYVNNVADQVLQHVPDLQDELEFYVIKSTSANAFTTNNGVILVSLGLIAQLQDEAQLAFILAHEISHYQSNDVIRKFMEKKKIEAGEGNYEDLDYGQIDWAQNKYSREIEIKADEGGWQIYKQTDYYVSELPGVMDVLHYSYLPFEDRPFQTDFLETKHLSFPDEYFLKKDEINSIETTNEDYNAVNSTHPNTKDRKEKLNNLIYGVDKKQEKSFLHSRDAFNHARNLARFEMSRLYYMDRDYVNAIYNSYLLLNEFPSNQYLRKIVAKSLYNLTVYKNNSLFTKVVKPHKQVEGEIQQLHNFLEELTEEELNATSLIYCWHLKQEFPDDKDLEILSKNLLKKFVTQHEDNLESLSDISRQEAKRKQIAKDTASNTTNKYKKINKLKTKLAPENIVKFAFVGLLDGGNFVELFKKYANEKGQKDGIESTYNETRRFYSHRYYKDQEIQKKGKDLGIDKVVIVDPFFQKFDQRKDAYIQTLKSEKAEKKYREHIESISDQLGLATTFIQPSRLEQNNVEKYNELAYLNEWVTERTTHTDGVIPIITDERARKLSEKYGTPYFNWTGTITLTERETGKWGYFFMATVPPLTPLAILEILNAENYTYYFNLVFNIKNGKPLLSESENIRQKDRKDIIKSHLYFSLQQIQAER